MQILIRRGKYARKSEPLVSQIQLIEIVNQYHSDGQPFKVADIYDKLFPGQKKRNRSCLYSVFRAIFELVKKGWLKKIANRPWKTKYYTYAKNLDFKMESLKKIDHFIENPDEIK